MQFGIEIPDTRMTKLETFTTGNETLNYGEQIFSFAQSFITFEKVIYQFPFEDSLCQIKFNILWEVKISSFIHHESS